MACRACIDATAAVNGDAHQWSRDANAVMMVHTLIKVVVLARMMVGVAQVTGRRVRSNPIKCSNAALPIALEVTPPRTQRTAVKIMTSRFC
jgi:hypothetical protein